MPLALVASAAGGIRVTALTQEAERYGVHLDQLMSDARALCPSLQIEEADEATDLDALEALSYWCGRYSPWVAPARRHNGQDGIFIDITGCAHLFGGEDDMLTDISRRLRRFGLETRIGLADTPGAAWAAAKFLCGQKRYVALSEKGQSRALQPLPVSALRLDDVIVDGLNAMGLKTIGHLTDLPRAPLTERFGTDVAHRLDQALGIDEEPISPNMPLVPYRLRKTLAEPIVRDADVLVAIEQTAQDLCRQLIEDQQGVRRLEAILYRVDGKVMRLQVGTSTPSCDAVHLSGLFTEKLEAIKQDFDAGYGIDMIALDALAVEKIKVFQTMMQGVTQREQRREEASEQAVVPKKKAKAYPTFTPELGALVDRLGNRLGMQNVHRMHPHESHVPEQAVMPIPLMSVQAGARVDHNPHAWSGGEAGQGARPLSMLRAAEPVEVVAEVPEGPPRMFRWRRVTYTVARTDGPERVAQEWWQTGDTTGSGGRTRDYYKVEDEEGRRFWLYRDGLYNRELSDPQWYVHGVFA